MASLKRVSKLGEGAYGTVYSAIQTSDRGETKHVAIKRNFKDLSSNFVGAVRELSMMARLNGHPFILNLDAVSFGDPFTKGNPMTPVNPDRRKMQEDKVHFVMEYIPSPGDAFFHNKQLCTPLVTKILMVQLLLAVEFMHSRRVTHRDLKPANLLISVGTTEGKPNPSTVQLKVCDFGMSQVLCSATPSTPGVATSWYRAPEICCSVPTYNYISDIWALGCIFFEMVAPYPFLAGVEDSDTGAFNALVHRLPKAPERSSIQVMFEQGKRIPYTPISGVRRRDFNQMLSVSPAYLRDFNSTPGSMDQFIELLNATLVFEPERRMNATQILNSEFFRFLREYINGNRELYPPIHPPFPPVQIIKCMERSWAINVAFNIYNRREEISWYQHRLIFHAIELFDRYLAWAWSPTNSAVTLKPLETAFMGRLHSKYDTELRFYLCLYLMHKFFATMTFPLEWRVFVDPSFATPEAELVVEHFEILLIKDVTAYQVYGESLFEMSEQYGIKITEALIHKLLREYGTIRSWDNLGSMRALYRQIMQMTD